MTTGTEDAPRPRRLGPAAAFRAHWPEYLMEAAALGLFMVSAGVFTTWIDGPHSFLPAAPRWAGVRRGVIGLAMGGTATGLIYSPWGRRSGAQMNPAITLAFLRLGRIPPWDAAYYILFQFLGGVAGVWLTAWGLGTPFTQAPIHYVVTVPGPAGAGAAFAGEFIIGTVMMGMIAAVSNRVGWARYTGLLAGVLIFLFVTFESPYSGFGMNPARTVASAWPSGIWTAGWIYFIAPTAGMLLAAETAARVPRRTPIRCCKLHHRSDRPCIFCGQRVSRGF